MSAIPRFGRISALLRRFTQSLYASTAPSFSSLRLVERHRATEHWHPKSAAADDFGGEFGVSAPERAAVATARELRNSQFMAGRQESFAGPARLSVCGLNLHSLDRRYFAHKNGTTRRQPAVI